MPEHNIAPSDVKAKVKDIIPYIDRMRVWLSEAPEFDLTKLESLCTMLHKPNQRPMNYWEPITGKRIYDEKWKYKLDMEQPQIEAITYLNDNIHCDYLINYVEIAIDYTANNKDDVKLIRRFFDRYLVKKWHVSKSMVRIAEKSNVDWYDADPDFFANVGTTYYVNENRRKFTEFSLEEFTGIKYTVVKLCKAINDDKYEIPNVYNINTVNWLNEILRSPELYDQIRKKWGDRKFTELIRTRDLLNGKTEPTELLENLKRDYDITSKAQEKKGDMLKMLNRALLERFYPEVTPIGFRRKPQIQVVVYSDRPSKINRKPCCHIEVRFHNSRAVTNERRAVFEDYLRRHFFRVFWDKYLDIRLIKEEELIEQKILKIMHKKRPDKNQSELTIITRIYMRLFRLDGGILKAQNIIDYGKYIDAQRKFLIKDNTLFLPKG